jgi:hypothetical protein
MPRRCSAGPHEEILLRESRPARLKSIWKTLEQRGDYLSISATLVAIKEGRRGKKAAGLGKKLRISTYFVPNLAKTHR